MSSGSTLERLRAGDEGAFVAVYAQYAERVYAFAYSLSQRRDVADDLFQVAWLRLAERSSELSAGANVLAWLLTVARNEYRSAHRKRTVRQRHEPQIVERSREAERPDQTLEARSQLMLVSAAVRALPEPHREVIALLIDSEGLPRAEMARVLGVSDAALRKRISRARLALMEKTRELTHPREMPAPERRR